MTKGLSSLYTSTMYKFLFALFFLIPLFASIDEEKQIKYDAYALEELIEKVAIFRGKRIFLIKEETNLLRFLSSDQSIDCVVYQEPNCDFYYDVVHNILLVRKYNCRISEIFSHERQKDGPNNFCCDICFGGDFYKKDFSGSLVRTISKPLIETVGKVIVDLISSAIAFNQITNNEKAPIQV